MLLTRVIIVLGLVSSYSTVISQSLTIADTLDLRLIDISASKIRQYDPSKTLITIDSSDLSRRSYRDLGSLLNAVTPAATRSYSFGGSSALSLRGMEPRHTMVSWNGFNINSATLGLTDLSLIPVSVTGNVSLIRGSSSVFAGNSSMGGSVMIGQAKPEFREKSFGEALITAGSFGSYSGELTYFTGGNSIESRTHLFYGESENDFSFTNKAKKDHPEENLKNADINRAGFLQDIAINFSKNKYLTGSLWYQQTSRSIPPLMTIPDSEAEQEDEILRSFLRYTGESGSLFYSAGIAFFDEKQAYSDAQLEIASNYDVNTIAGDLDLRLRMNEKIVITAGSQISGSSASFEEYKDGKSRTIFSLFTGLLFNDQKNLTIEASIRSEFANIEEPPLQFFLSGEYRILDELAALHISAGNHFTLPTLNDLYWVPGGNSGLKPEHGKSMEAGLRIGRDEKTRITGSLDYYHMAVDDWIKWYPTTSGYYSPDNIKTVNSEGIELIVRYNTTYGWLGIRTSGWYTWSRSVTAESDEPYSQNVVNKQLVYIPEHSGGLKLDLNCKKFTIYYNHNFTGQQYTNIDNSRHIDSYTVADAGIEYRMSSHHSQYVIFGDVNNVWNESYQVMAWRPMPGMWFQAGIRITFNLKAS